MTLYKLTNGLGEYWVIAETATEANDKLMEILDDGDGYGSSNKRIVQQYNVIAEEITKSSGRYYLTGCFLIC